MASASASTNVNDNVPTLSLRMIPGSGPDLATSVHTVDNSLESFTVLVSQDTAYTCRDYLGRRRKRGGSDSTDHDFPVLVPEEMVDEVCREKMCEWSYRVCDHFHTSREIVAFAFSFLDRFVDKCSCDRTAFKLAAMTSLYMATKMLNAKQLSIHSLAELSRGEFEMAHIAEMERIILETLEWRMNPPTVQSFILILGQLLPKLDFPNLDDVYDRSVFFAELCVYDYNFVTDERIIIAVACILNVIEGIDSEQHAVVLKHEFLESLKMTYNLTFEASALDKVQARLWFLYSCSAQLQRDDIIPLYFAQERLVKYNFMSEQDIVSHSPVCVNIKDQF